jgi:hypothetical protein
MIENEAGIRIKRNGVIVKFIIPIEFWHISPKFLSIYPSEVCTISDLETIISDLKSNRPQILEDLGTYVSIVAKEGDTLDLDIPSGLFLDELIQALQTIVELYRNKEGVEIEIIA